MRQKCIIVRKRTTLKAQKLKIRRADVTHRSSVREGECHVQTYGGRPLMTVSDYK